MKKLVMFIGLICTVMGLLSAQVFNPTQYDESTLSDFNRRRFDDVRGEARRIKLSALFDSRKDVTLQFIDPNLDEKISFETESLWPHLLDGQEVTLYFTALGPWIWDRQLDAIDYGNNRLVQANTIGTLPQGSVPFIGMSSPGASQTSSAIPSINANQNVPAANPTTAEIASSREKPAEEAAPASGFSYGTSPKTVAPPPQKIIVQISGRAPQTGRYYRLQIGSFSVRGNATRASDKLKALGLSPSFEEFQNKVRVVLPRVRGEDVVATAQKIGSAGFSEVWCREEQ
ncbi:MAG: SPOR domain-containing protein [Treponema sp.]|jgi:hypothetical protein|nr:SPOR domain-containing protein [Treponema sp.]